MFKQKIVFAGMILCMTLAVMNTPLSRIRA